MSKKVIVIGSSGGIGSAVAKTLLNEGYEVLGTSNNNSGGSPKEEKVDLNSLESVKNFYNKHKKENIYAIVNCAGIVKFEGENIEKDFEYWQETININLSCNYYLARLFHKNIIENGRFIMISSTDSYYGGAITASYSASKAGVNSLTKSLSLMFKDKKIRVNSIAPGWIDTPMIEGESDNFYTKLAQTNPLERIGKPEDVAKLVNFLLSSDSDYLNGQVVTLDGGYTNQDPTLLIEEKSKS